jgi:hypothetical protein
MTTKFYDGQRYELVRTQRHTRVDGSETTLSVWQSERAVCGKAFEVRGPARARRFAPSRRCEEHKRSGERVNRRKKHASRSRLARRPPARKNFPSTAAKQRWFHEEYAAGIRHLYINVRPMVVGCAGIKGALQEIIQHTPNRSRSQRGLASHARGSSLG